jgi:hypothetical protein
LVFHERVEFEPEPGTDPEPVAKLV